jgi:hypothetical protein
MSEIVDDYLQDSAGAQVPYAAATARNETVPREFGRVVSLGTAIGSVSVMLLAALVFLLALPQFGDGGGPGTGGGGSSSGRGKGGTSNESATGETSDGTNATATAAAPQNQRGRGNSAVRDKNTPRTSPPQDQPSREASRKLRRKDSEDYGLAPILPPDTPKNPGSNADSKAGSAGGGESSEFFGIKAKGRRFVYIVDRSGSMGGVLLERARTELMRAVKELNKRQRFYVYFFSSRTSPMFDPPPNDKSAKKLLRATPENVQKLQAWVARMSAGGGTHPQPAILEALKFKPHAIFLLSDGRFDPNTPNIVRQSNTEKIPIYTIGFVHKVGEPGLKQIADESGGTYQFVP